MEKYTYLPSCLHFPHRRRVPFTPDPTGTDLTMMTNVLPTSLVRGERQALAIDESVKNEDAEQEHTKAWRRLRTGNGVYLEQEGMEVNACHLLVTLYCPSII